MDARERKDKIIDKIIDVVVANSNRMISSTFVLDLDFKNINRIHYSGGSYDINLGRGFWLACFIKEEKLTKRKNITTGWKETDLEEFYQTILEGLKENEGR